VTLVIFIHKSTQSSDLFLKILVSLFRFQHLVANMVGRFLTLAAFLCAGVSNAAELSDASIVIGPSVPSDASFLFGDPKNMFDEVHFQSK
jgi:hypothetical protein